MSPDYRKVIAILDKINSIQIEGKAINSFFISDGYDMWASYQMAIFADIKRYTAYPLEYKKDKKKAFSIFRVILLLESILAVLVISPEVLVYTIDKVSSKIHNNDSRIDSLYQVMSRNRVNFLEVVHYVSVNETLNNFFRRKRLVVYLESLFFFKKRIPKLHVEIPDSPDKDFILHTIEKYHARFYSTFYFYKLLKHIKPKVFIGIDDVRHTGELLLQLQHAQIPSYFLQHGHFTKYHVGWLDYTRKLGNIPRADYIIVWNEYWKNELIRLGTYYPQENILIGGEKVMQAKNSNLKSSSEVSVLIPYETDAPKVEIIEYVKQLKSEGIKVYLKVRNDIPHAKQIAEYGGDIEATTDVLSVTAVLGVYSTFLYDVIGILPVGLFKTSMDYGYGMIENGLAGLVSPGRLKDQILALRVTHLEAGGKFLPDTLYSILSSCGVHLRK